MLHGLPHHYTIVPDFMSRNAVEHQSIKLPRGWSGSLHAYAISVALQGQSDVRTM